MKLTTREIAALKVIGGQPFTHPDSGLLQFFVGRAPRLTAGALCRKGLVAPVDQEGVRGYGITPAGRAELDRLTASTESSKGY